MKEYPHEFRENFHYTPGDFDKAGGLWPLRTGQTQAKPSYYVGPRMIECFSLHFVLSGSVYFSQGERVHRLNTNDLFCIYPQIRHSYWVDAETKSPLRMHWLAFFGEQASLLVNRIGISERRPYLQNVMTPELSERLTRLLFILERQQSGDDIKALTNMYGLFELLQRPEDSPGKNTAWLEKSVKFMNTHFMEGISVAEVVQVAGVHRSHLYSEFNRQMGMSPQQYLIKLRMEQAAKMLKETSCSITEIALSLGYSDLYPFSRAFYYYFEQSPTDFRMALPKRKRMETRQNDK